MIEILIVFSIVLILGGIGFFLSTSDLQGHLFRSDRDVLVSALEHARAEAMANICRGNNCEGGKDYGVFLDEINHRYVIFQGSTYDPDSPYNISLEAESNINYAFFGLSDHAVVFQAVSGKTFSNGYISLVDSSGRKSQININTEGQISWSS